MALAALAFHFEKAHLRHLPLALGFSAAVMVVLLCTEVVPEALQVRVERAVREPLEALQVRVTRAVREPLEALQVRVKRAVREPLEALQVRVNYCYVSPCAPCLWSSALSVCEPPEAAQQVHSRCTGCTAGAEDR
jgi:hypothetical protein